MCINFTFHNVSINTWMPPSSDMILNLSLHSTMFLLIPRKENKHHEKHRPLHSTMFLLILGRVITIYNITIFTFHNVSINTSSGTSGQSKKESLHSTMFLLILFAAAMTTMIIYFTFHNVSINTTYRIRQSGGVSYFTFHNVSINTASREISNVPFGLYIPQCFY